MVDCHCHVFDPARFPYGADARFRPAGQEIAPAAQMAAVFDAYGMRRALLVQPNSGYETDNRCLLDAIAGHPGQWKGIAVVDHGIGLDALQRLQAQGIVGVAFNLTYHGEAYYADTRALLDKLAALDMVLQLQVEGEQLLAMLPLLAQSPTRLLIDHCGRPDPALGLEQAGFQALLGLGRTGRAVVKLSGAGKFSHAAHPFADTWPYLHALVDAFTPARCVWGSDWPFLRAPQRVDYGPLLLLAGALFPDPALQRALFWDTPCRWFGFDHGSLGIALEFGEQDVDHSDPGMKRRDSVWSTARLRSAPRRRAWQPTRGRRGRNCFPARRRRGRRSPRSAAGGRRARARPAPAGAADPGWSAPPDDPASGGPPGTSARSRAGASVMPTWPRSTLPRRQAGARSRGAGPVPCSARWTSRATVARPPECPPGAIRR